MPGRVVAHMQTLFLASPAGCFISFFSFLAINKLNVRQNVSVKVKRSCTNESRTQYADLLSENATFSLFFFVRYNYTSSA